MRPDTRRAAGVVSIVLVLLFVSACAGQAPSTLDAAGYGARRVEGLWWLMFWISVAVFVEVLTLLGWALLWRRRPGTKVRQGEATGFVVTLGVVVPAVILLAVYGVGLRDLDALGDPVEEPSVTVEVVGHRWWWEVRYPDAGAVTANEIHIPVDEPVRVVLRTADVQHSFWVPQLMPKTDLIAGRVNETWLRADRVGRFRGECAEYCGLQHAHMYFMVVAEPRERFDEWLADLAAPAPLPDTAAALRGREVFQALACGACHTVRGTAAQGASGPDLTNFGQRWSIGAGAAPNDRGHLGGWVVNSQTIKPGNNMPPQPVPAQALPDLLAYLQSLR